MMVSTTPSASVTPAARATAASSSTMRRYMRHVSGVSRITPIGDRVSAVVPAWALINRYFSQSTRRMSAEISTGTPAAARASRSRVARGLTRPSSSPKTIRPSSVWAMRPGDSMVAKTKAAPPSARPRPSTSSRISSLSTPFCKDTTPVSGPSAGESASAAVRVSNDLTQNSATSTGGWPANESTASTLAVNSPSTAERTRRPSRRIASRCAPRASTTTDSPARASFAPK